ncbi:MAG: cobalt ECF transporter T component CbiQ [Candidatus Omnitrophica bacterium]|nr:cobalt ECF transporter T component CbiQ [Candidatus Omnitrophota bacterium]MCM8809638.1 cobalt ECF transporter T component CbiQ [Candidatus Omnitrophota bacterium]MCM8811319.1 cobalt ECF transporter T component CbiQ [Candidatus Omnitrophota bacterium]
MIDPRLRLIIGFFYSIFVALEKDFGFLGYYSILPLILSIFISDFSKFLKGFITVNFFIVLMWIFLPFSIPGKEVVKILKLSATYEGIRYSTLITIKANLIFITNFILIFSSHPIITIHALHHLHLPKKLVNIFFLSTRYIPVIEDEKNRLERAMKIRCFKPKNDIHTYKTIGNLFGLIVLRAYEKSKIIYKAMILRNFSGIFWTYHHFIWKKRDTFICLCAIIYFLWIIYLKIH